MWNILRYSIKFILLLCLSATFAFAQDYDYIELNPFTGNLDATRSDSSLEEVISHSDLDDMDATVHDSRYLNLDSETTDVTNGTFDFTTTGTGSFGDMGIGTTEPGYDLEIAGGELFLGDLVGIPGKLYIAEADSNDQLILQGTGDNAWQFTTFGTNADATIDFTHGGAGSLKVGIGDSSPDYPFEILSLTTPPIRYLKY